MGLVLIPTTLHTEHFCMVWILYIKCPPASLLGCRYKAGKVLILSMLLVVPLLTAYTHDPGGYGGNTVFLLVIISLGDITGCTSLFLLIKMIIFTVETTSSLNHRAGICSISFESIDLTHLTFSFTNLIPYFMKGTWELVSRQYRIITCSLSSVLHDLNAQSAYITFTTKL